jgi:hypothetical protein
MALSVEEKGLVEEALSLYVQFVARQVPQAQVQQIATIAQGIIKKLDSADGEPMAKGSNKPKGITDEWFNNVCETCAKLSNTGCTDKVTEKYPGKCDPILHYEQQKILAKK